MSIPLTLPKAPTEDAQKTPLSILALDGGGVRGLSSLLILKELMDRIAVRRGAFLPWQYFDLIIGTGTGGISALFLGRMHMSVDQAIKEYICLAETAFKPKSRRILQRFHSQKSLLDGATLEENISEIVERNLGDRNARLGCSPPDPAECRTAVLAATSANADAPPYIFRSYTDGKRPASIFTVCEVARATASTAGLFAPVMLGDPPIEFVDAEVAGYNNPADFGLQEAEQLWPGRQIGCLVSIGTGHQEIVSLKHTSAGMSRAFKELVKNCEKVHEQLQRMRFPYFRFNVGRGLENSKVDIMEWNVAGPRGVLAGITDAYTRTHQVKEDLGRCVNTLAIGTPSHVRRVELSLESPRVAANPYAPRLLSVLAMLPSGVSRDDLPSICPRIHNADEVAMTLCEASLAYEDASHILHVPFTVFTYISKRHPPTFDFKDVRYFHFGMVEQWNCDVSGAHDRLIHHEKNVEAVITYALNQALATGKDEEGRVVEVALNWARFLSLTNPRTAVVQLALRVIQAQPERNQLATCLYWLGNLQYMTSEYDAARTSLTQARESFKASQDQRGFALCLCLLGELQNKAGNDDAAQQSFAEALQTFLKINDMSGRAACLLSLGNVQRRADKYDQARITLAEARRAFENVNDWPAAASCLFSLGELEYTTGDYTMARMYLMEARQKFQVVQNRRGEGNCLRWLGETQSKTADHHTAQKSLTDAHQIYTAINDRSGVASCLLSLGNVQRRAADYDKARQTLNKALEAFEFINDSDGIAACNLSIERLDFPTKDDAGRDTPLTPQVVHN